MELTTDAERVLAPGTQITLSDGSTRVLRFDYDGLGRLEIKYNGLNQWIEAIESKMAGPMFLAIADGVRATVQDPDPDSVVDLLEPSKWKEHSDAIDAAFTQAFPPKVAPHRSKKTGGSRGPKSSGSSVSTTDDETTSGAA